MLDSRELGLPRANTSVILYFAKKRTKKRNRYPGLCRGVGHVLFPSVSKVEDGVQKNQTSTLGIPVYVAVPLSARGIRDCTLCQELRR